MIGIHDSVCVMSILQLRSWSDIDFREYVAALNGWSRAHVPRMKQVAVHQ